MSGSDSRSTFESTGRMAWLAGTAPGLMGAA